MPEDKEPLAIQRVLVELDALAACCWAGRRWGAQGAQHIHIPPSYLLKGLPSRSVV